MATRGSMYVLGVCVITQCFLYVSAQYESMELGNNGNNRSDENPGYKIHQSVPPGFNDKTHYGDGHSVTHPYDDNGAYNLVPPFLIGASTVIVVYIVAHCIYFHCYATRKMKRLAERQYPPAIVISDDPTSTASYKTFTPVLQYNEHGELLEGQSFVFYQPFDDDEWERQMALRRNSSIRSSRRSSTRSMSGKRKSSSSLKLPFFGRRRPSECPSIAEDHQEGSSANDSPKPHRVRLLPVSRSLSVPGKTDKCESSTAQGYYFSPVVLARTQSCKTPAGRKVSFKAPKLIESASEGDLKPQNQFPIPQVIIIGAGNAGASTSSQNAAASESASGTDTLQKEKSATQVLFHIGGDGEESEVRLCDIKEEQE